MGSLLLSDKSCIAVLPFDNPGGDAEQDYSADGMFESIIIRLAELEKLIVITRDASYCYKGKLVKMRRVGKELGSSIHGPQPIKC